MAHTRLVGIARGSRDVLIQRTVVADEQGAFGRIDALDPFEIELDDGRRVRVEPSSDARVEPLETQSVAWGDIENDPSFAGLRERGPEPHVKVTVKRSAIDPSGATWASSVRLVTTDTEKKHVFADVVVIGGNIVVAGRAVTPAKGEPARFLEGRADSLVFYATGRYMDARAKARMHLLRRHAAIGSLVLAAAAIGGLMAIYEPSLPVFHVEGGE